jgi:DNA primase
MSFSSEFLNQIRAKTRISIVVGRRVALRKQGREWTGASPFTPDDVSSDEAIERLAASAGMPIT